MGIRSDGFSKVTRGGKPRWVIDFRYTDKEGREQRYRRDASVQSAVGARVETGRLKQLALETGCADLSPKPRAITFAEFIDTKFRPVHMPTECRPATRERYEALLRQGILAEFGARRLDEPWNMPMRQYAAKLTARGVQTRAHLTLVRTVLRSAVELGEISRMPDVPPLPRQSKKLPDAPSDDDVTALLANARGWLRVAIALSVFAGLRMGEVRALEVRDVDLTHGRILVRRALSGDEVMPPKSGGQSRPRRPSRPRASRHPRRSDAPQAPDRARDRHEHGLDAEAHVHARDAEDPRTAHRPTRVVLPLASSLLLLDAHPSRRKHRSGARARRPLALGDHAALRARDGVGLGSDHFSPG